ncbi:hypothetical protein QHF89_18540 [Polyangium sorediatum]|uniref:Uncharacterized protein n=1 Tax=Polyangium sorediatum TaxID=889274 RepID=A0ABT6NT28_9BACT|nr:hypothetical protein [Polyangium sorediatum]
MRLVPATLDWTNGAALATLGAVVLDRRSPRDVRRRPCAFGAGLATFGAALATLGAVVLDGAALPRKTRKAWRRGSHASRPLGGAAALGLTRAHSHA